MATEREIKEFSIKNISKDIKAEMNNWEIAYLQGGLLFVRKGKTELIFPLENVEFVKVDLIEVPEPQEATRPFKKAEEKADGTEGTEEVD